MIRRMLSAYLGAVEFSLEVASEVILWPLAPVAMAQALCHNISQTIEAGMNMR